MLTHFPYTTLVRSCDTQCRGAWHQRAPVRRLRRSLMRHVVFLLAALAAATAVQAQQTRTDTIYRCTNALGALTIQNGIPCPKGSKQEVQRSEEHTSELQSLMRISYAVFCLKK